MYKKPEVKLGALRKGDCFMFNNSPYIVTKTFWEDIGLIKRKVYECREKYHGWEYNFIRDTDVYRISRALFDIIVQGEESTDD
jgi:hypothetical protein